MTIYIFTLQFQLIDFFLVNKAILYALWVDHSHNHVLKCLTDQTLWTETLLWITMGQLLRFFTVLILQSVLKWDSIFYHVHFTDMEKTISLSTKSFMNFNFYINFENRRLSCVCVCVKWNRSRNPKCISNGCNTIRTV